MTELNAGPLPPSCDWPPHATALDRWSVPTADCPSQNKLNTVTGATGSEPTASASWRQAPNYSHRRNWRWTYNQCVLAPSPQLQSVHPGAKPPTTVTVATGGEPTVSASWRQTPRGSRPKFFLQINLCDRSPYVTSSVTKGWVCLLWIGFALVYFT
jgi:hypothetical protein